MTTDTRAALVEAMADAEWVAIAGRRSPPTASERATCLQVAQSALTALSAKLSELGLRIVPAEATEAMIEIGGAVKRDNNDLLTDRGIAWNVYDAMIAASPDPLAQEASDG